MIMNIGVIKHILLVDKSSELRKTLLDGTREDQWEILRQLMLKEDRTQTESLLVATVCSASGMMKEADKEFQYCLANRPDDAAAHLLYAMHALQSSELKAVAVSHFEEALKLERKNAAYPYFYGFCLWSARRGVTAKEDALRTKELYERAIELNQKCASAHNELGLLLWDVLGQPDEAEEHFKQAVEIAPKDARGHGTYAVYLMEYKEDKKEAKRHFKRAIKLDPNDAQNYFDYGRLLTTRFHDNDGALAEMERAVEIDPDFGPAYLGIAKIRLLAFQDVERAREAMRAGLRLSNSDDVPEETLDQLGDRELVEWAMDEADLYTKNPEVQKTLYELASEISPGNATVCAELGVTLWLLVENDEAKTVLEEGLRLNPDDAELNYLCGHVLHHGFNDIEGGKRYYSRAIVLDPDNGTYHRALARLLMRSGGDSLEIERHLKEALRLEPDALESHRDYGIFLMDQLKDYDRAKEELEEALSFEDIYNEDAEVYIYLARAVMLTNKDDEEALEQFKMALEINPHFHEGRREFAIFLLEYRYEGPKKAKALYQDYLRKYPYSARARMDYAILLKERFNHPGRAREQMEKAFALDPKNADCLKMLEELDKEVESAKAVGKKVKKTK